MAYRDRAAVVASIVMLGLVLTTVVDLPTWSVQRQILGSPLTLTFSQTWLVGAVLMALVCAGTDSIVRSHPLAQTGQVHLSFVTWIPPALAVFLATFFLGQAPTRLYWAGGILLTGLVLVLVISAEYLSVDPSAAAYPSARLTLNVLAYLLALVAFVLIYASRTRSLLSATAVTVVGGLLALEFLRTAGQGFGRTLLYALIAGLATGEIVWAMNYWRISGLTGGLILLLGFYVATGLANQQLQGRLHRRIVAEYAGVFVVGLFVLLQFGP
jgi:hypothetical protein